MQLLDSLETDCPVTIFVGDNGSGKSTLLEAMAIAANLVTIGSEDLNTDPTLANHRQFAQYLQMVWNRRPQRGFFLRAEDFFGFTRRLAQERAAMLEELEAVDARYQGRSQLALTLARAPIASPCMLGKNVTAPILTPIPMAKPFLRYFKPDLFQGIVSPR